MVLWLGPAAEGLYENLTKGTRDLSHEGKERKVHSPCAGYLAHPWAFVGRFSLTGDVILALPGMGPAIARKRGEEQSSAEGVLNPISPDRQPWLRHRLSVGGVPLRGSNHGTSVWVSDARVIVVQAT